MHIKKNTSKKYLRKIKFLLSAIITIIFISCSENQKLDVERTKTGIEKEDGHIKIGNTLAITDYTLNEINNKKLDASKVIVLEFWATWCGPCIAAFPDLEKIQKKYKNDVLIAGVTDESKETVDNFLDKHSYDLAFFTDKDKKLFKHFNVEGIPFTALISNTGEFLWAGNARGLNSILESYVATNKIPDKQTNIARTDPTTSKYYSKPKTNIRTNKKLLEYQIEYSNSEDKFFSMGGWTNRNKPINLKYSSTPIINIIEDLTDSPSTRIINNRKELDTILINLRVKSKSNSHTFKSFSKIIFNDISSLFDIKVEKKNKKTEVFKFKMIDSAKLNKAEEFTKGGGFGESKNGKYMITRFYLEDLASVFESKLNGSYHFMSEINIDKKYNFEFNESIFEDIMVLKEELLEKYGITIESKIENVEFVEIN